MSTSSDPRRGRRRRWLCWLAGLACLLLGTSVAYWVVVVNRITMLSPPAKQVPVRTALRHAWAPVPLPAHLHEPEAWGRGVATKGFWVVSAQFPTSQVRPYLTTLDRTVEDFHLAGQPECTEAIRNAGYVMDWMPRRLPRPEATDVLGAAVIPSVERDTLVLTYLLVARTGDPSTASLLVVVQDG
jgi:hypothetical protein